MTALHLETLAVRGGRADLHAMGVHVPPVDRSSTSPLPSLEQGGQAYEQLASGGRPPAGGNVYQRLWNTGVGRFEDALAGLEGSDGAVAFASGMAAFAACLQASVAQGRPHVVAVRPLYGGTDHVLATGVLGTSVTWVEPDGVAGALRAETGLVVVETPANPTLDLVDLRAMAASAGDVPLLVDNTFATPVLQRPMEHGAALVLHSATKYLGGHGDVVGGVVAATAEWVTRLRQIRVVTGALLNPDAAYLLHRGLQTLPIRVRAQQATAQALALRLREHPAVLRVLQPGLEPSPLVGPGRQQDGPGAVFSVEVDGGLAAATALVESCRLATLAVSLGGTETLVQHPASLTHRPVEDARRPPDGLVRLSIGLEHVDDLADDLLRALDAAAACVPDRPRAAVTAGF